ncbi:MAG: TolC family protein [Rhodospirillales bacterium]|nr:TolC family protein [Rhodospirillales bacterium]MCB9996659.1 TolC family protein [Rhodospirillales bacterium]
MSFNRLSLLAKASVLAVSVCSLAVPVRAETLVDAVGTALNHHPSVEAALANRNAYAEERQEQWADHFPNLNVRGAGGRMYGDNSTSRGLTVSRGATYSYLWEGSVTLTQPIFDGFETFNRVDAADFRKESADFHIADIREDLALRTVMAYLDVLRAQESMARIKNHEKKIADYQGRIQKMVDEGAAEESMVVQARDIKAQLDNTLAGIEGQLKTAYAKYAELTGYVPDEEMEKPVPRLDMIPESTAEAVEYAAQNHPALRAASLSEKALEMDTEAEKQFYYPDVNGELSYLKRDQREEIGGEAVDAKAVVRLNWDLSVAGGQMAKVKKSRHRQYESKAQMMETERQIERDVRISYSDMATAREQVDVLKERMQINNDLFKNYEAQFEGARINLLQLLQADNARFNTGLSLMNAEYRHLASQFAILASMGRLQEALNLVVAGNNERR